VPAKPQTGAYPALAGYGVSLQYHTQHELAFQSLFMDMDIVANDTEGLFDSHLEAYAAFYRFSPEIARLRLGGILGWFYAAAGTEGSLTASNQHFAYFPYNFYTIYGSLGLHAGFAAVDLQRDFSFFRGRVILGAAHAFQGSGAADIHYKKKNLFGGEEVFDKASLDIEGIGAAFMLLDAGFPALRLGKGKKGHLSLGLRKLFVLPWGYEQAPAGVTASPDPSDPATGKLLKTLLLSGLSLYGSLYW
jgi:hypothetical protein